MKIITRFNLPHSFDSMEFSLFFSLTSVAEFFEVEETPTGFSVYLKNVFLFSVNHQKLVFQESLTFI